MPHVFISHSHADAPKVEELGQRLKDAGLSPWISAEQLERGGAFSPQLSRAIASADAVVYVHTNRAASRYWVTAELHYALRNAVPIVVLEYDRLHESSEIAFILAGSTERIRRAGQSAREFFSAARAAIKKVQRKRAPALAVWNAKGGVGKTSIAANLALCLAAFEKLQKRVLLIDLDPQHNLSQIILPQDDLEKIQGEEKTVVAAFEPTRFSGSSVSPLDDYTTIMAGANYRPPTAADLSWSGEHERLLGHFELICGDVGLAKYTMRHPPDRMQVCKDRFMEFMSLACQQYDIVLIDCNPSFSFLTECAVDSCSHIISPVTPDSFALRGLRALRNITQQAYATTVPEQIVLMNRIASNQAPHATEASLRGNEAFGPRTLKARLRQSNYLKTPEGDVAARNPLSSLAYFRSGAGATEVHADLEAVAYELCKRLEIQINDL